MLRADARQHGLPATRRRRWRGGSCRCSRAATRSCARRRRASGWCGTSIRSWRGRLAAPTVSASCRSCSSTGSAWRTWAPYYPHRVAYHPTCHSLRVLDVGDAPLRLLRAVRGLELVEHAERGGVLRVRRDVRGQERGDVGGDARRQVPVPAASGAEVVQRGRQLVPDAHRRRALARGRGARGRCISPRSWPPRERIAARFPEAAERELGERPAAREPAQRDAHDPRQARARSWRRCPTGRSCGRPAARSSSRRCERLDEYLVQFEEAVDRRRRARALGARRGRGEPHRRARSCAATARPRRSRSSRWRPTRSASTRRSPRRASRRWRPTSRS